MCRIRRSNLSVALLILIAAAMPSCSSSSASRATDSVESIHPDAVTEISMTVGSSVALMLPGNAGTGYDWVLAGDLPGFLRQSGTPQFVAKDVSKVGSQGDTRFVFEAMAAGEGTIRFHYLRSWKQDAKPARWAEAAVTVTIAKSASD